MFSLSKKSLEKLEGVHPKLVEVCLEAIKITPIDFGIVQGVRTQAQQDALYEQGRTTPGPIVTWTRQSDHIPKTDGYGHAIDFAAFVDGKITWDDKYYTPIAEAILKAAKGLGINLDAGAYWKKPDYGHIAIKDIG